MNRKETMNDSSWEKLFNRYHVLDQIGKYGKHIISSDQIKEYREPRLMAKADNKESLPAIFKENRLAILPITRREYCISPIDVYKEIQPIDSEIKQVAFPSYVKSLDITELRSETMAINAAMAAGIFNDFLSEEGLVPTVSGRMSSGSFSFQIQNSVRNCLQDLSVSNSQIEIDIAMEGFSSLTLVEAKLYTAPDFLVRQLYYPFRTWVDKLNKKVRTIFLVFSNGVFNFYEFSFPDPFNYNSISLIKTMRYSFDDTRITTEDIELLANTVIFVDEPRVPFPQADKFERVIDLCSNLYNKDMSLEEIALDYGFDIRQADYYSAAGIYLGLVDKKTVTGITLFTLTDIAKKIFDLNYKDRQLALCEKILAHKVFMDVYILSLNQEPSLQDIVTIMKANELFNIQSDETFKRRAQTIRSWIEWIFTLVEP